MKLRPGIKDVLWMTVGAVPFLILILVLHFRPGKDATAELASNAERVDLVERMQRDLASASEAEKSAVLATTDEDSQKFATLARSSSANVDEERRELGDLLTNGGTQGERELLAQFTPSFDEFKRIDNDLLALAVQNTNIKAYGLAFGPAATTVNEMNAALARLIAANADSPEARKAMPAAFGAQISALRIETLLPPHIAEESDQKMDEFEALMTVDDTQVRKDLSALSSVPKLRNNPELATATARYAEFSKIRTKILALSRENTNVRSLSISLKQKRKAMLVCQAALGALQQAIQAEPIAGTAYGARARPR
jgi:hypothetical protein